MANIRDHCSWVHPDERAAATTKAKDLVRMAVAQARLLEPLRTQPRFRCSTSALVIGGGAGGDDGGSVTGRPGLRRLPGRAGAAARRPPSPLCTGALGGAVDPQAWSLAQSLARPRHPGIWSSRDVDRSPYQAELRRLFPRLWVTSPRAAQPRRLRLADLDPPRRHHCRHRRAGVPRAESTSAAADPARPDAAAVRDAAGAYVEADHHRRVVLRPWRPGRTRAARGDDPVRGAGRRRCARVSAAPRP